MDRGSPRRISPRLVGAVIGTSQRSVSARSTMAYAAVTGAAEACYYVDRDRPAPLAPPGFAVVLEWPILNGPDWRAALGADQRMMQDCVHVGQDSRFLQPLRAGDTVTTTGRVVALRQTRVGVLVHVALQTTRDPGGDACIRSVFSAIFLRAELDGPAPDALVPLPTLRALRDVPPGGPEIALDVPRALPFTYTECAGIWNPIHTERRAALAAGFDDILLHGTCTWAMSANAVVARCLGGDPTRLRRFAGAFHAPVTPPQRLTLALAPEGAAPIPQAGPSRRIGLCVRTAGGDLALHSALADVTAG